MSVPITIYLPKSTIDAIRESAGINSNIRVVAQATAATMPAIIAAVNSIPADVIAVPPQRDVSNPNKRPRLSTEFEITVKTTEAWIYTLHVRSDTLLEDAKAMLEEQSDHPVHQQRWIFNGKQLEDGRKLDDYGINANSGPLHMILRLRGS